MNIDTSKNLFGLAPVRPVMASSPQGTRPTGGSFGGDALQLSGTGDARSAMLQTFQAGVARDLAGANQLQTLSNHLSQLSLAQVESLQSLLAQATSQTEQIFILKAYAAGEPWQNLVQYATEMRSRPEAEIISRSTMRDDADVVQQWQDSCGPTLVQTIAGEADPRFAWELNKAGDLAKIDPAGAAKAIADQQKQWLEQYGGVAVERGQSGGQGMALNDILNGMMGPVVGGTYTTMEVSDPGAALDDVSRTVAAGYDVPIRISWNRPGDSADSGHFVLAMSVRGNPGSREFQIHDPWTGKTAWVAEASIRQNSFAPIFGSYARMSHYYPAQASASA